MRVRSVCAVKCALSVLRGVDVPASEHVALSYDARKLA